MYSYICQQNELKITATPSFEKDEVIGFEHNFIWTYNILVENFGKHPVKILARYWKIIDSLGNIREVHGDGVVGKTPIIYPGKKFQYSSFAQLSVSSGIMYGKYKVMDLETESLFYITIPAFSLDGPVENKVYN